MPTICSQCEYLFVPEGQRAKWFNWLCVANKLPPTFNPVTGNSDAFQPYKRCSRVNDGECPDFKAGPTIINPREMPK